MEIFENITDWIRYVGIQTMRYGKRFFKRLVSLLLKPVKLLGSLIFTFFIVIDKHALKAFHNSVDEVKALVEDARKVSFNYTGTDKNVLKRFAYYVKKAVEKYTGTFKYAFNFVLPILSLMVLINVIGLWSDTTFALEINYNDEVIGYVKDEAVYKEARQLAFDRLDINAASVGITQDSSGDGEIIGNAEYKIKPVRRSQINDASEICDNLIEKSENEITNACGVYIDDNFICAVKNETDALSVFDSILAQHETDDENAVVSFVENIDYVQGLYPDNESTIKDAEFLQKKLNSKKSEARYYTVVEGDTVSQIAEKYDMRSSELFALNPQLKENIYVGQVILLSKEVNFIQVQTTKTEYKDVEVDYDTIKVNTSSLYVGDTRTVTKGKNGVDRITQLVTYIDGVKVSTKEISRETIKEPVSEKIQVGTKKGSASSGSVIPGKGRLAWPAIGAYSISSDYGYRNFGDGWHGGIDIVRPGGSSGCTVVAAESGVVTFAGWYGSGGYTVIIDHGGGLSTVYCHMQNSLRVSSGQRVSRGQAIGKIGATGYVTGAHLHFEVKLNGRNVDPGPYLGV